MPNARRTVSVNMDPGLHDAIRRHAFERTVSINKLITDILSIWVLAATDRTDPLFSPRAMPLGLPQPPVAPYPEYLESLVFEVNDRAQEE